MKKQINLNGKIIDKKKKINAETEEYKKSIEEKEIEPVWKKFEK